MNARRLAYLVSLLIGAGCDSEETDTVTGEWTWEFVALDNASLARDLSQRSFRVYALRHENFDLYPSDRDVTGTIFGTFAVPGVPKNSTVLLKSTGKYGITWYQLSGMVSNRRTRVLGRPNAQPATVTTPLFINAVNLSPWSSADELIANCWTNATDVHAALTNPLTPGATEIHQSFDWAGFTSSSHAPGGGPYLIDSRQGDTLTISRLERSSVSNGTFQRIRQVLVSSSVVQTDGVSSEVNASFTDVPTMGQYAVTINSDAIRSKLPFDLQPGQWTFSLTTGPGTHLGVPSGPPLASVSGVDAGGVVSETIDYGNPFDASWSLAIVAGYVPIRRVTLPGGVQLHPSWAGLSGLWDIRPVDEGGQYLFSPDATIGHVTLNGSDVHERFIPWDGSSNIELRVDESIHEWQLDVFRVYLDDGAAQLEQLAEIYATQSTLVLPSEVFRLGDYHVLRLWTSIPSTSGAQTSGSAVMTGKFLLANPADSRCGDGVVDGERGEACDDGNTSEDDGCRSACGV